MKRNFFVRTLVTLLTILTFALTAYADSGILG